jgi:hypothetical protein
MALELLIALAIPLVLLFLGCIPLFIAVKVLDGDATFLKVVSIKLLAVIISAVLSIFLGILGAPLGVIIMLFIYMYAFKLGFFKALFAWLIEIAVFGLFSLAAIA